jgi:hypothetical protein
MAPKCGQCEECLCPDRKKPCARRFKLYKPEHAPPCTPADMIGRSTRSKAVLVSPSPVPQAAKRKATEAPEDDTHDTHVTPRKRPQRESALAGVAAVPKPRRRASPVFPPAPTPRETQRGCTRSGSC